MCVWAFIKFLVSLVIWPEDMYNDNDAVPPGWFPTVSWNYEKFRCPFCKELLVLKAIFDDLKRKTKGTYRYFCPEIFSQRCNDDTCSAPKPSSSIAVPLHVLEHCGLLSIVCKYCNGRIKCSVQNYVFSLNQHLQNDCQQLPCLVCRRGQVLSGCDPDAKYNPSSLRKHRSLHIIQESLMCMHNMRRSVESTFTMLMNNVSAGDFLVDERHLHNLFIEETNLLHYMRGFTSRLRNGISPLEHPRISHSFSSPIISRGNLRLAANSSNAPPSPPPPPPPSSPSPPSRSAPRRPAPY